MSGGTHPRQPPRVLGTEARAQPGTGRGESGCATSGRMEDARNLGMRDEGPGRAQEAALLVPEAHLSSSLTGTSRGVRPKASLWDLRINAFPPPVAAAVARKIIGSPPTG